MPLTGIHIACAPLGGVNNNPTSAAIDAPTWSETLATSGTTTNTVPAKNSYGAVSYLEVSTSVDSFVAIGAAPNAVTGPRLFISAGQRRTILPNVGDRVAWAPA